ncbi:MAG: Uma2 family endonuclease [Thermodesulfovibrionales bacterium]|nr:Uma2 family endonuclease [Thermodesulfovibrionales bacterium]
MASDIHFLLKKIVDEKGIGYVFGAPIDVIISNDNVVSLRLFIYQKIERLIKKKGIFGVPDMIIEILSLSSHYRDTYEKKAIYERAGVREHWLVDPCMKTIEIRY